MDSDAPISPAARGENAADRRLFLLAWWGVLALAAAKLVETYYRLGGTVLAESRHFAADFIVFWTASRSDRPYDFEALTAAQQWYMQTPVLRPFAYPPSFLPWIEPFAGLPMLTSYALWTVLTAGVFVLAWSRLVRPWIALAALALPVCLMGLIPGQMIFLLGALLAIGIFLLGRRPVAAGLLLGLAATIKPQALLLVPLALLAGRHWAALAAAAVSGLLVGLACIAAQGPALWLEWFGSLPAFSTVLHQSGMMEFGTTPSTTVARLGLDGPAATAFVAINGLIGLAAIWCAFRKSSDPLLRLVILNAGTILVLPYAMPYELALSAPAVLGLLLDRRLHPAVWIGSFFLLAGATQAVGPLILCTVYLLRPNFFEPRADDERATAAMPSGPRPAPASA